MALFQSSSLSTIQLSIQKHKFLNTSQNPKAFNFHNSETLRYPLISLSYTVPCSPLRSTSCAGRDISDDVTSEEASSISSVFVKGLSDSVSEGRLKKVFSDFGEVTNVKIIIKERTRQSLGYGYVWFNSKEDAELAVEAMNGKFFDGRFILVKLGQPGMSPRRRSHSDSLFGK